MPVQPPPPTAYYGPTEPIDVVARRVNATAARVPSAWADLEYHAKLIDPQHRETDAAGDGSLQFRRPTSLRLTGTKDVAGEVFNIGCDGDQFWCKFRTGAASSDYWWGHLANVGKPCCRGVPIRPDLVIEVLGVGLMPTDLLQQPTPVMRFDNERDQYVFDFNVRRADRWVTVKEVAYDRATALPRRVGLYDDAGRLVLRAELSDHRPLGDGGPPVAHGFDLWFPDTGSTLALRLGDDAAVTHQGRRTALPNDASFRRPEPEGGDRLIQVDEGCEGTRSGDEVSG